MHIHPITDFYDTWSKSLIYLKGEIDQITIILWDFNIPVLGIDETSRQKISKNIHDLNSTIKELDVIDIYKTFHLTTTEYTSSQGHVKYSLRYTTFWAITKP